MTLGERFSKLEARERTLLTALLGIFAFAIFVLVPVYVLKAVGDRRDENQAIRDFIQTVNESRSKIAERKAINEGLVAKYSKTIPANFIQEAARTNGMEIAETSKKPDVAHGKKFTEHVQVVRLSRVSMLGIAKMLERLERGDYPLSINKLNIKPRAGQPDEFDVEIGISTYERKPDAKKVDKPGEKTDAGAKDGADKEDGEEP